VVVKAAPLNPPVRGVPRPSPMEGEPEPYCVLRSVPALHELNPSISERLQVQDELIKCVVS
jgi:hypothetical protein